MNREDTCSSPIHSVHSALPASIKFSFPAATSEDLRFDDEILTACEMVRQEIENEIEICIIPKFFATS